MAALVSLRDFIQTNVNESGKLTREVLDKAITSGLKIGSTPRHDCGFDGHVLVYGTKRCMYCGFPILVS